MIIRRKKYYILYLDNYIDRTLMGVLVGFRDKEMKLSNAIKSTKPVRVLCVFGSLDRGGAETMCMNLFRHIDRNEVVFDFVKHTDKIGAYEEEIKELGGRVYTCPPLTTKSYFQYVKWWNKHFVNHQEHLIVHGHMFTTSGIYFRIARKYKRITVGHSHFDSGGIGTKDRSYAETAIRKLLRDRISLYSDYRLACSDAAGKLIFPNDNFLVLNNAIDVRQYKFDECSRLEIRKEFGVHDDYIMIVVIGSVVSRKNPTGIIEICKELEKKSEKWKLIWCGTGSLIGKVKERIVKEKLTEHIVMAGTRNDIHKVLQGADLFLMPSLHEGLPVAAVEAQAAGIPCFLSDTISSETDITGLCHFLPLNQWELWADMMLDQKLEHRDTTEMIKKAGYDINTTSKWLQNYYLQMLNNHTMTVN